MRKKESNWVQRKQRQEEEEKWRDSPRGSTKACVSTSSVPQDTCFLLRTSLYSVTPGSFWEDTYRWWELPLSHRVSDLWEIRAVPVMSRIHNAGAKGTHVMCHSCSQPQNWTKAILLPWPCWHSARGASGGTTCLAKSCTLQL